MVNEIAVSISEVFMKPCNRCGLCCELSLCSKGRRRDKKVKGNCLYLIKHEDNITSCQLILEGKMKFDCINFKGGCLIQEEYPKMYEFQMEYRKAIKEIKNKIQSKSYNFSRNDSLD